MMPNRRNMTMGGTFGERLLMLIREKELTQKELACLTDVTEAAMSHYCKGDRIPRASVMAKIAEALGTTSDYLMNGSTTDSQGEINQAKRLIARNVAQMTHEEKMDIISILLRK